MTDTITITTEHTIERVQHLLCAAWEGGSSYWAQCDGEMKAVCSSMGGEATAKSFHELMSKHTGNVVVTLDTGEVLPCVSGYQPQD